MGFRYWNSKYGTAELETAFAARAGPNARKELARLRNNPDVRKLIELGQPGKMAQLVDAVTENINRRALVGLLGLRRSFATFATGDPALMAANPEHQSVEATERFIQNAEQSAIEALA